MRLGLLDNQEEISKKSSSRIDEKRKLGEECELLYIKDRKILGFFRSFPEFSCTSFL
jgi:hypothetical protein